MHRNYRDSKKADAGWAPTPSAIAQQGLEWFYLGPDDLLYGLGCGDGCVAIEAAN